jgi:Flp pilus assembly protein TadD
MIGIALFGITVTFQQSSRTEVRYREQADAALAMGDYTTARLCFERLLQITQTDPALWYGLARSLDGLHQVSESAAILLRIAPVDAPGYPPAQLWLAEQLLESGHNDQTNRLAEQHLRRVIDAEPENAAAQSLLAALASKRNVGSSAR